MSLRYQFTGQLEGSLWGEISDLLCECFDGRAALEGFINEKFGRKMVNGIAWNKALNYVCNDIVSYCERNGKIGALLTALREERPDDTKVSALISGMVQSGALTEQKDAQ